MLAGSFLAALHVSLCVCGLPALYTPAPARVACASLACTCVCGRVTLHRAVLLCLRAALVLLVTEH